MSEYRVVLRLFSGRPNPEWPLPKDVDDEIVGQLKNLPEQPRPFRPQILRGKPDDVLGRPRSGYQGFEIFPDDESDVPIFQIYSELVLDRATGRIRSDRTNKWEEVVWRTAPPDVIKDLDNITLAELRTPDNEALIEDVQGAFVRVDCTHGPLYDGSQTDPFNQFRGRNNCYNYATGKLNQARGVNAAIPGRNNRRRRFSEDGLREAMTADRLEFKGKTQPTACPEEGTHWMAAMVRHVAGRLPDFHCLRLDRSGKWSHKDGRGVVEDADNAGDPIRDLTQARLIGNPKLVGFFLVDEQFLNMIS